MSTVGADVSGDSPGPLPVTVTDAIAAAQSCLAQCLSVLSQSEQTGLTVQAYAAVAQAAAAASQAAAALAYNRTTVSDTDRAGTTSDVYVEWTVLTAPRVYTLPPAASCAPGRSITIADASGNCSSTNTLTVSVGGSDTFVGNLSSPSIGAPGASIQLMPTSINSWIVR